MNAKDIIVQYPGEREDIRLLGARIHPGDDDGENRKRGEDAGGGNADDHPRVLAEGVHNCKTKRNTPNMHSTETLNYTPPDSG